MMGKNSGRVVGIDRRPTTEKMRIMETIWQDRRRRRRGKDGKYLKPTRVRVI